MGSRLLLRRRCQVRGTRKNVFSLCSSLLCLLLCWRGYLFLMQLFHETSMMHPDFPGTAARPVLPAVRA